MSANKPSLVFFGTPAFAVTALEKLVNSNLFEIAAVVTQPDQPAGRGQQLQSSPVKNFALKHQIKVFQPTSLKGDNDLTNFLNSRNKIDAFIVVAYGKIIPQSLFDFPIHGTLNIHASLLPRWRGAAPIQHAIFAGDKVTGVSIMKIASGLDTGPVYYSEEIIIEDQDNFGSLHNKLSKLGSEILVKILPDILNSKLQAKEQSEVGITYAHKWEKSDLEIRWDEPANVTIRRIRACAPVPGARTTFSDQQIKIFSAHKVTTGLYSATYPGTVVEVNKIELIVSTGLSEYISIDEMQFPGKNRLPIADILKGRIFKIGDRFGSK